MATPKELNLQAFHVRLPELLASETTRGKFVIVHGGAVRGSFDTFDAALRDAVMHYPADEFVIQQVIDARDRINFVRAAV